MKIAIGTAMFVLLAGSTMYAQEQEKEKPSQQEEKKQEPAKKEAPAPKEHPATHEQQKAQPQEQQKAQEQQQKAQQHQAQEQQKNQSKEAEKQQQTARQQQQQAAKQQQVAKQQQQQQQVARQEHVNGQQAQRDGGNRNARRINEQEFHQHFGREHEFRVTRSEDRRFNYGGYYWVYNDPWPSGWAYTDEVYVDEIDGEYYLIDPVHPGIRLLVVITD
jgi:hypothetical protein